MAEISIASSDDYGYLKQHDHHITPFVLLKKLGDGEILIAVEAGEIVGWLRYNFFWDSIPFMNMLFVEESMRGQGIGSQLVTFWEKQMREAGHNMVMTSTLSNESAQEFYRLLEYEDAGMLNMPGEAPEIIFRKVLMG
jgi:ribosomal protein S18 acetylase RimI-like enzyme